MTNNPYQSSIDFNNASRNYRESQQAQADYQRGMRDAALNVQSKTPEPQAYWDGHRGYEQAQRSQICLQQPEPGEAFARFAKKVLITGVSAGAGLVALIVGGIYTLENTEIVATDSTVYCADKTGEGKQRIFKNWDETTKNVPLRPDRPASVKPREIYEGMPCNIPPGKSRRSIVADGRIVKIEGR